jgi:hypothetical protein
LFVGGERRSIIAPDSGGEGAAMYPGAAKYPEGFGKTIEKPTAQCLEYNIYK